MRFKFDTTKSERLRKTRGSGFEEAQELFYSHYYLALRREVLEQWLAVGWVKAQLYSVICELRIDEEGEYYHLVTLWKSTKEESKLYEECS